MKKQVKAKKIKNWNLFVKKEVWLVYFLSVIKYLF